MFFKTLMAVPMKIAISFMYDRIVGIEENHRTDAKEKNKIDHLMVQESMYTYFAMKELFSSYEVTLYSIWLIINKTDWEADKEADKEAEIKKHIMHVLFSQSEKNKELLHQMQPVFLKRLDNFGGLLKEFKEFDKKETFLEDLINEANRKKEENGN